jgi:hypothetical protein
VIFNLQFAVSAVTAAAVSAAGEASRSSHVGSVEPVQLILGIVLTVVVPMRRKLTGKQIQLVAAP